MNYNAEKYLMHLRVAEKGKLLCLEGKYMESLMHLKEAIRMIQDTPKSDIFFQHYSLCVMEVLELSEAYDEVISYCEKLIELLESTNITSELRDKYYAFIIERMAIQYILKGETDCAADLLKSARERYRSSKMPITEQLLIWLNRKFHLSKKQIQELEKNNNYFVIRKDSVNPDIAVELPEKFHNKSNI
jgi:tetratricopeptide (TPR) repeat protein